MYVYYIMHNMTKICLHVCSHPRSKFLHFSSPNHQAVLLQLQGRWWWSEMVPLIPHNKRDFNLCVCGSGQLVPVASDPYVLSVCEGGGYMNPYQFLEFTTGSTSATTMNLYMSLYYSMALNHITVTCNVICIITP